MFRPKKKYLGWNPRAKRYVLTIEGEKGVKGMLNEPFEGAIMKNCTGQEHIELEDDTFEVDEKILREPKEKVDEKEPKSFFESFFGSD